jgi:DNA modification methylase
MTRAKVPTDGLVADPYAGSGSTGVAALASGRSFWGCEIEERYAEVAARRLEQAEHDGQQVGMFGPPP